MKRRKIENRKTAQWCRLWRCVYCKQHTVSYNDNDNKMHYVTLDVRLSQCHSIWTILYAARWSFIDRIMLWNEFCTICLLVCVFHLFHRTNSSGIEIIRCVCGKRILVRCYHNIHIHGSSSSSRSSNSNNGFYFGSIRCVYVIISYLSP